MRLSRQHFPLFDYHPQLIYFDNAATTQKPQTVIERINQFYSHQNAPIKRGVYQLAEEATSFYENARQRVADFIGADYEEIVFTSGATEGINFIAAAWAWQHLQEDDEIVLTELEHHSNLLPWQQLARKKNIKLTFIPVTAHGMLDLTHIDRIITKKTKLVSFLDVSNALGTHIDVHKLVQQARKVGAHVLIDACQSVPHQRVDVKKYDCDFLVFSGHKVLGPTGIGVLYINKNVHDHVAPYQLGGGMVFQAHTDHAAFLPPPHRYEAGTPPIAQAIGLGEAVYYLQQQVDFDQLKKLEARLCAHLIDGLNALPGFTILGPIEQLKKMGHLVSFTHESIHFHDIAAYLNQFSICVRAGHYCAQPLAQRLGIDGSVRVSFYLYNSLDQVAYFLEKLSDMRL